MTSITCLNNTDGGVCATMDEAGRGLGIFLSIMAQSLPVLLIILAMVSVVVGVGLGIAHLIRSGIGGTHK